MQKFEQLIDFYKRASYKRSFQVVMISYQSDDISSIPRW